MANQGKIVQKSREDTNSVKNAARNYRDNQKNEMKRTGLNSLINNLTDVDIAEKRTKNNLKTGVPLPAGQTRGVVSVNQSSVYRT